MIKSNRGAPTIRCMGAQTHRWQCNHCKRLPQTMEDEEARKWIDHTAMASEVGRGCKHYLSREAS